MFSLVMIFVPAYATLSVRTGSNGRKMLIIEELGVRLWGQAAIDLARLHKSSQDAVITGYVRPMTSENGNIFPAIAITSVRSTKTTVQESTDLDDILGQTKAPKANGGRSKKTLAKALSD